MRIILWLGSRVSKTGPVALTARRRLNRTSMMMAATDSTSATAAPP